jgi:hypothetical protein
MASNALTMAAITTSAAARDTVFLAATEVTNAAASAVVESAVAMTAVSISIPSLNVVAANPVSWGLFSKSDYYEPNIKTVLANYAAVDPATYATVHCCFCRM